MVRFQGRWARSLAYGATAVLVIAACSGTTTPTTAPTTSATTPTGPTAVAPTPVKSTAVTPTAVVPSASAVAPSASAEAPSASAVEASASASTGPGGLPQGTPGGTVYLLKNAADFDSYDPQRVYTGEDLAFFGATIMRSLVAYKLSDDPAQGVTIVPDMATDTGTASADAKTWTFTLRDGLTWQDGSALKCEDIQYGVSRTFAEDVINGGPTYAVVYLDIPTASDGSSMYKGPYTGEGQDLFNKAVTCDGQTITFHLNQPVSDFNFTTTLGFGAVPNPTDHPGVDTAENYVGDAVWSDGPYKITTYNPTTGGSLILDRNTAWNRDSDPIPWRFPGEVGSRLRPRCEGHRPAPPAEHRQRRIRGRLRRSPA